eukprot:3348221-Karenia_brevis.AAC.1
MAAQPKLPTIICGDLNGSIPNFPTLEDKIQDGSLIDVGMASFNDNTDLNIPTCHPHTSTQSFRRDYFLATSDIFPYINDFKVCRDENIPVHSRLSIHLDIPGESIMRSELKKPRSIYDTFLDHFNTKHQIPEGGHAPQKVWQQELDKLHEHMDNHWGLVQHAFHTYTQQ